MGMTGEFRQASPRALALLRERPDLARAVVSFAPGAGDEPLPPNVRKLVESMAEHERARFEAVARAATRRAMRALRLAPLWSKLAGQRSPAQDDSRALDDAGITAEDLPEPLFIEKAWHGFHFLLAGEPGPVSGPLAGVVLGGHELGEDLGYGPLRVLAPDEVRASADALDALDDAEIDRRFDGEAMLAAHVYPEVWDEPREELVEWMVETLRDVRRYYGDARDKGFGMLLYVV
jgi:hypothetical protein